MVRKMNQCPIKLCECGCGNPPPLAPQTDKKRGWVKGQPIRFILNHHFKHPKYIQKSIEAHQTKAFREKERKAKLGSLNPNWKGDQIKMQSGRLRAERKFKISKCEKCGHKAHDRHHKNGNPINNESGNIQILCRRCHMIEDGRMNQLIKRITQKNKSKK